MAISPSSQAVLPVLPRTPRYALVGSPNSGKSTLFNALTGLRTRVANYPGVTVERCEGESELPGGTRLELVDLPGLYSTEALSVEERVALEVLDGKMPGCPPVDGVLFVADSTTLARSLPLLGAFLRRGQPLVLVLTMIDEIKARGGAIRIRELEQILGVPVVGIVGNRGIGVDDLKALLADPRGRAAPAPRLPVPEDPTQRFAWADTVLRQAYQPPRKGTWLTDHLDALLLHPVLGVILFATVMLFFFQAIFSWAVPLQDLMETGVGMAGSFLTRLLPEGLLRKVLVDGVVGGVGSVVVFVPQIALLFALLSLLEQVGYMSRAVFVIDRLMGWIGLDGRSFVALLSSYACAIPGILATRAIPDPRNRLSTILVAPFMTCSARLPVYTLLIAAFVPAWPVLGFLNLQGLVMMGLYALGAVTALLAATVLRRGLLRGRTVPFYVELPPYRIPSWKVLLRGVTIPVARFLKRAGTVILVASLVLWALLNFPPVDPPAAVQAEGEQAVRAYEIQHSLAGQMGHALEPLVAPLGFDWRIAIGLVASLAAREVIVATLGQIYAVEADADHLGSLSEKLPSFLQPPGGAPGSQAGVAVALSLLIFFVFALQCVSTLVVMRRETGSWKWPAAAFSFMLALAYTASFLTYRVTLWVLS